MKVILSTRAESYISLKRKYRPTDSAIPLTGAQRVRIEGYFFDYDLIDGEVRIQGINSSTAVNTIEIEDDMAYEADEDQPQPRGLR